MSLGALVSLLGRQGSRFSLPSVRCALKSSSFAPLNSGVARLREARSAEVPRPCAHRAATGLGHGPVLLPPCTSTPPTLSTQPGSTRAGTSRVPLALRRLGPRLRRPVFPASLQPSPCSGVLAPRSGPAGSRSQRAGSGPAQRRLRNPWLGLWRGMMSVQVGWSLDLDSRALSSRANPGSQSQPPLPPRLRGGKQCDRPELWAGPQLPRPPPGGTRLRPASGSPQLIRLSQAG